MMFSNMKPTQPSPDTRATFMLKKSCHISGMISTAKRTQEVVEQKNIFLVSYVHSVTSCLFQFEPIKCSVNPTVLLGMYVIPKMCNIRL